MRDATSLGSMRRACVALLVFAWPSAADAQTCYQYPFDPGTITDPWGCAAACGRSSPHRGTDFGVRCGSAIPAVADGVVVANEHSGCLGWVIAIQHPDGMVSGYAHMPSASPIPVGAAVTRGQTIGTSGEAGSCAFGCHLHMTMGTSLDSWWTGATIDPVAYVGAHAAGSTCDEGSAVLLEQTSAYAPPSSTDVNGDGRADVCARAGDGVHCFPATGTGWSDSFAVVPWDDAGTWNDARYYATLRMGDLDGDGRADVCIRSNSDFLCARSTGTSFEPASVWLPGMSDAGGWGAPEHFTTIRLADVDGDGREDLCARDVSGFGCWISDGTAFGRRIDGPRWSNAAGFTAAQYYGTLRMGDVNGDGLADVCIRGGAGMQCALSDGEGFPTIVAGPEWSDASGFAQSRFWTTLRMGDVSGDGLDDLCIRTGIDYRCHFSTGSSFGAPIAVGALSDANGWADPTNYRTLRLGDVDGDGGDDLCGRGDAEMGCWAWTGAAFVQRAGPAWSDASGWAASPSYYDTIRLADHDGDGREDLCARSGAGWRCHLSRADGFSAEAVTTDQFSDAGGWSASPSYWSTLMSGGRCDVGVERCNGRDDDCDRTVDEDTCEDASVAAVDGGTRRIDGGTARPPLANGCSCDAGRRDAPLAVWALPLLLLWLHRRRLASLALLVLLLAAPSRLAAQTCYQYPFDPGTITDPWGCAAACGRSSPHRGTDFGVRCGSAIPAVADGTVVANEHSGCLGWVVAIQHPDGMVSGYAHMPSPSPFGIGAAVSRGQIIGTSGEAGSCAEGCHLHMTLGPSLDSWWTGTTVDPIGYIGGHTVCSCDRTNGHFTFSCDGPNAGAHCVSVDEPGDPDSWSDNYLCTPSDEGFVFSTAGPVDGLRCAMLGESADAHAAAWGDDFACAAADAPYELSWSSAGPRSGWSCVQFNEPSDPGTWNDNYLCERGVSCFHAGGFTFCNAGPSAGESCVSVDEPADPDTWSDNYFCASEAVGGEAVGLVWSVVGPVEGMTCTNVIEPSDPQTAAWNDNYLCVPSDSEYELSWSNAGPIAGLDCVRWYEAADLRGTWNDNYLCVRHVVRTPDSGAPDGGRDASRPDGGRADGGVSRAPASTCGCRAGATSQPVGYALLLLLLIARRR